MALNYSPQPKIVEDHLAGNENGPKLLCTIPTHFMPGFCEQLERHFHVQYGYNVPVEQVKKWAQDANAYVTNPGAPYPVDAALLEDAKKLKIIITPSTGTDHIDKKYCAAHDIKFLSLRGQEDIIANIHASAEFSFALLLAVIKKLPIAEKAATLGYWREVEDEFRGIELADKTLGLIGYGRIGKKMSRYAHGFGANIIVFDPFVTVKDEWATQVDSIDAIYKQSDIVSVHVHLDPETTNLVSRDAFLKMKKGVYFINTARGAVIDESALLEMLDSGHVTAAGVDVIEGEQSGRVGQSALIEYAKNHHNLIVTPHIAGLTVDSQRKAGEFALKELLQFFNLI